jgi:DNA-directed RNA polymerase subunit L
MEPAFSHSSEENGILKFTLSGINVSLANAIRRIILNDIDTVVFRTETYNDNKCNISVNTGRLHNEILKQRLSCIPIHSSDPNELPGKYILELDETNEKEHTIYVTTEQFKIKNKETGVYMGKADVNRIFPADSITKQYIDFCRLRPKIGNVPGEQIKLTCEFSIANSGVNNMFNVVSKCAYGYTIDSAKVKDAWEKNENKMKADGIPETDIQFARENFYLLDAQRYFVENSFDFSVATLGVFTNNEIMKKACAIMQGKILDFMKNVEEQTVPIEPSIVSMVNSFDVVLENEDYTLGKALEFYLYQKYFIEEKKLEFCAFKKLHPHDVISRIRIAYKDTTTVNNIQNDLMTACRDLQDIYVTIHGFF